MKIELNDSRVSEVIEEWFKENEDNILNNKSFWSVNKLAKVIKTNLIKHGKWIDKPRGNPKAGYIKMKEKLKQNELNPNPPPKPDDNW